MKLGTWLLPLVGLLAGCDGASSVKPAMVAQSSDPTVTAPLSSLSPTAPPASAQPPSSAAPSASAKAPGPTGNRPILFSLTSGAATNYVFGTMHAGMDLEKDIDPVVLQSLDASTSAAFEVDTDKIDPMAAAALMMLPPGKSAKDGLTTAQWKTLTDKVAGLLMPESSLEAMKPWALGALYVQKLLPATDPMDKELLDRARAQKKNVFFLETIDEQMKILDKAFDQRVLVDMLSDPADTERTTLGLAAAYRAGDLGPFERFAFDPEDMKKHPAMFELVLFKRNDAWIPKLKTPLERGGVFVAVGAAHVVGDRGIVKLLEQQGFTVKRVEPSN
jgi:hypothetical protein